MFCKSFKNISFFVVHLSQSISTLFCAPRPNTKNGRVPYPRPPAILSAFLRQQHPQRKPLILPVQRHRSAALFGGGAHTAQVDYHTPDERLDAAKRAATLWNIGKVVSSHPGE